MLTVNLFDTAVGHLVKPDGKFSVVHLKYSDNIRYVKNQMDFPGTTIFTESHIFDLPRRVRSKKKIGWLLENRTMHPSFYEKAVDATKDLDFIMTHDKRLLDLGSNKFKFMPFGGCWILKENMKIHEKNKNVSMIYSSKKYLPGHILRHQIAKVYNQKIDLYGHGSPRPLPIKDPALIPYRFSVVIENISDYNYFTEKLIDCLSTGTIPIYWGCPNIGDFFDDKGILCMNDLERVLRSPEKIYDELKDVVKKNYELSKQYEVNEDYAFNKGYLS